MLQQIHHPIEHHRIRDYALNVSGGDIGAIIHIPANSIAIDFVCDWRSATYEIVRNGRSCQYFGNHQFIRPICPIEGGHLLYGAYTLILPPTVSGHLCYLAMDDIGYPEGY
jgi:hypothetical protein